MKTITCFGDSITAMGYWTEPFKLRLQKEFPGEFQLISKAISGNKLLHDSPPSVMGAYGETGILRFEKDVYGTENPDYVIILIGINDLIHPLEFAMPEQTVSAEEILQGLKKLTAISHLHGSKVYGATILPCVDFALWNAESEEKRNIINATIRRGDVFDQIIDFADLFETETLPGDFLEDGLHPAEQGGQRMANMIPLTLF